jgi:DNA-binding NtrC family response regulator
MNHRYKVLIVDEKEEALIALKKLLEQEGYAVETNQSSIEALEKIKNDKYQIVLTNTCMPKMDGIELLKEIKKYDPMTQIIMMTEDSTMDTILSCLEYGANDYIYRHLRDDAYITKVIEYSVQKLERWREAIQQIVI